MPADASKTVEYPLREKRKTKTRESLLDAAAELLFEVGYDNMTLDQVAERAEVHVQTLYRHFPTKLAIILELNAYALDELTSLLKNRESGVSTISVWRAIVKKYSSVTDKGLVLYTPSGPAAPAFWELMDRYVSVLTAGLAIDMGVSARSRDRRPYLLACMLKASNDIEAMRWNASGRKGSLTKKLVAIVDDIADRYVSID